MEVALRQGLVHPITCVPYLIALETDQLDVNSKLAHHLLMNMNEKYYSETLFIIFLFVSFLLLTICWIISGIQPSLRVVWVMDYSCHLTSYDQ